MGKFIQYEKYGSMNDYVKSLEEIVTEERNIKENKIVLTYGVFDILHLGHTTFLNKIKEKYHGILFVNVANDIRAKYRKGSDKPINSSYSRALLLSELEMVDYITVHPEEKSSPAWKLASIIKPDYMIQSWPWTKEAKKELKELLNYMPKLIHSNQHFPGTHSSKQVREILKNYTESESILMRFKELIPKFENLLAQTGNKIIPEDSVLIESFKDLSKKSKSYENIKTLVSLALKIKQTYDLSFSELDSFVSELTKSCIKSPEQKSEEGATPKENLIKKPEEFTEDSDFLSDEN